MRYLYLDPTFKPYGTVGSIEHESKTWSGGEEHVKITDKSIVAYSDVTIVSRANNSSEVMRILMANDALQLLDLNLTLHLFTPYLPYARQDRVMKPGEALSTRVYADMINACNFKSVSLFDPHSPVGVALLRNFKILEKEYYSFVKEALFEITKNLAAGTKVAVASPDSGAFKKIHNTCENVGYDGEIIICDKVRDLATNNIYDIRIGGDVAGKVIIIIDDLVDGGRTFVDLGKKLKEKGASAVYLIITHGIFSYGEETLKQYIDKIISSNSFRTFESDYVKFIDIKI